MFRDEFGRLQHQYGPRGAALAWFTWSADSSELAKRDVLGTSGADYVSKFAAGYGDGAGAAPAASGAPQAGAALQN